MDEQRKPTPNHIPTVRELAAKWNVDVEWLGKKLLQVSNHRRVSTVELLSACSFVPRTAERCSVAIEAIAGELGVTTEQLFNIMLRHCVSVNVEPETLVAALWFQVGELPPLELAMRRLELALTNVQLRKASPRA